MNSQQCPRRLQLAVDGITCTGCTTGLRLGLLGLPEVADVTVDVAAGQVTVSGDHLDPSRIREQLRWLGFPPRDTEAHHEDR